MTRRTRRRIRRARPLLWLVVVVTGLLLVGGAVVGMQALQARKDLVAARSSIVAAHQAVTEGDQDRARDALDDARNRTRSARGHLTDWVWRAYGKLPAAGPAVREAKGLIEVSDVVTNQVLAPLVAAAPSAGTWSGRADVEVLRRTAVPLSLADERLGVARARLAALPVSRVAVLDRARADLSKAVNSLAVDVRDAAVAAKVLPDLLGADRPSHLLLVTQNLAEERATGGLVGAFALVRVDKGRMTLERSGTDDQLVDASAPVVDLGPDFRTRYGVSRAASTWRSANLTPDTPSAGAVLAGLSARQLKRAVDGVVFVDPVTLSYVLRASGPIPVPGLGTLTTDNAVPGLMKDIYRVYSRPADQSVRKAALRRALDAVVVRLQDPVAGRLARELARAVSTGHLQVYATDARLENELRRSRMAGALPTQGPFLSLVTQDVGGSKLGYYLSREVRYVASPSAVAVDLGAGPESEETATITIRLHNAAPAQGLPDYVTTRADALDGRPRPRGQLKTWVSVYLGPRSSYTSAALDGRPVHLASQVERGLTVLSTYVSIDPGQTVALTLTVRQPASQDSPLVWRQQPRIEPDRLEIRRAGAAVGYVSTFELP